MFNVFKRKLKSGDLVRPNDEWIKENVYGGDEVSMAQYKNAKWKIKATDSTACDFENHGGVWSLKHLVSSTPLKPILFKDMK